jgi:hypothetical protein
MKTPPSVIVASPHRFVRFTKLIVTYDQLGENFRKLWRLSIQPMAFVTSSARARELLATFGDGRRQQAELQALWPQEDIHHPSREFFVSRLTLLIGSFPGGAPASPELFSLAMLDHVMAVEASTMVIESTCRQLVETQKFVPAICKMLEELRYQKKKWAKRLEIDEAIRSGRLKQIGEKAIAALERRERGDRLRDWGLPERGTPEDDENHKIIREISRARHWADDACKFKGLDDDGPAIPDYGTSQMSAPKNDDDKDEEAGS